MDKPKRVYVNRKLQVIRFWIKLIEVLKCIYYAPLSK